MHRSPLPALALLILLSGCACPTFEGDDGVLTYASCTVRPDLPVQRSSQFEVKVTAPADSADGATWTSSDPSVLSTAPTEEGAQLLAWTVGTAEIETQLASGEVDRFSWEVTQATEAALLDPVAQFQAGGAAEDGFFGEPSALDVGDRIALTAGQTLTLDLELRRGAQVVAWAPSALVGQGSLRVDDEDTLVRLATDGEGTVLDDEGTALLTVSTFAIDALASPTLVISVFAPEREAPSAEQESATFGWISAALSDGGDRIWQPPLTWDVRGPGSVASLAERGFEDGLDRTDVASWSIEGEALSRWDRVSACVSVEIDGASGTVAGSVWLTPDGPEIFANVDCDGRAGCACAAGSSGAPSAVGLLGLATVVLGRRRRR